MKTRRHYIPVADAQVGMTLAERTNIVERGFLNMTLPAGHALTQENLGQLLAHHAEFIYIEQMDPRSDEQVAIDAALAARRVMQIFEGVDLNEPHMATFFDQVLAYRSA
jgi:hypothetical protein